MVPGAAVPVALGDGARFFTEVAADGNAKPGHVTMRVTEEFFGEAPNLAVLDGEAFDVDSVFAAHDRLRAWYRDLYTPADPPGLFLA